MSQSLRQNYQEIFVSFLFPFTGLAYIGKKILSSLIENLNKKSDFNLHNFYYTDYSRDISEKDHYPSHSQKGTKRESESWINHERNVLRCSFVEDFTGTNAASQVHGSRMIPARGIPCPFTISVKSE